jgi:hypothetical protein
MSRRYRQNPLQNDWDDGHTFYCPGSWNNCQRNGKVLKNKQYPVLPVVQYEIHSNLSSRPPQLCTVLARTGLRDLSSLIEGRVHESKLAPVRNVAIRACKVLAGLLELEDHIREICLERAC